MKYRSLILAGFILLFSACIEMKTMTKKTGATKGSDTKSSKSTPQTVGKGGNMIFYKDGVSVVPDWKLGKSTIEETSECSPYEGKKHYKFTYNTTDGWFPINLKNPKGKMDLTGVTHLRFAYKTSPGSPPWRMVNLYDGINKSDDAVPIEESEEYIVVEIPLRNFVKSKKMNLNSILGFSIAIMGDGYEPGFIYVDDISFIKKEEDPSAAALSTPEFSPSKDDLVLYTDNENQLGYLWIAPNVGLKGSEIEKGHAYEGKTCYKFTFKDKPGEWYGFSFYIPKIDVSKYKYLSIAYKTEGAEESYPQVTLMSGKKESSEPYELVPSPEYIVENIPIDELLEDSDADPSGIETIAFGFWDNPSAGSIYIDQIVFTKSEIKSEKVQPAKPAKIEKVKAPKKAIPVGTVGTVGAVSTVSKFEISDDDLIIYSDEDSYIDNMWIAEDVGLEGEEIEEDNPFEGIAHYKFTYKANAKWFGFNFSTGSGWDASDYKYLSIAYKTVGNEQETVNISLMTSKEERGKGFDLPYAPKYTVIHIPLNDLIGGTKVDPSYITVITFGFNPPNDYPGTLYIDQIVFTSRNK